MENLFLNIDPIPKTPGLFSDRVMGTRYCFAAKKIYLKQKSFTFFEKIIIYKDV
jgi:hypothetical protein